MNLRELKNAVDGAIESAADHGERPEEVTVSLQIDDPDNPNDGYVCSDDVTLHYDGNAQASGCVLQAWREPKGVEQTLKDAGYKTVSGANAVQEALDAASDGEVCCSGYGVFPDGQKCAGCSDCRPEAMAVKQEDGA